VKYESNLKSRLWW